MIIEINKSDKSVRLNGRKEKLIINKTNKNDIISILGPPSTKSSFNNDLWIYLERTTTSSKVTSLGKKTLLKNNVLILEINSMGLLEEKIFLDKDDMNDLKFSQGYTDKDYAKKSFVYDFLSSVRKKMNDPLDKKKRKTNQQ